MPVLTGPLQDDGPLVEVVLGWSASRARQLRAALRPVPPPLQTRALLDTGAETTCIDASLIQQLGLPFGGTAPVNLPAHGGFTFSSVHDASITILHPSGRARDHLAVLDLSVLELDLAALGYQALLGRDLLARCRFVYDGPKGTRATEIPLADRFCCEKTASDCEDWDNPVVRLTLVR